MNPPPSGGRPAEGDPRSLLDTAVSHIVQAVGGRAGIVRLWEDDPANEIASSSYGLSDEAIARLRPLVDGLLPHLGREQQRSVLAQINQGETLRAVALPLRTEGRLIGLLCLFQPVDSTAPADQRDDIIHQLATERVDVVVQNARLLERLLEEKRWLEAVVRYSADGILILDPTGRIVGLNPAFERIVGGRSDELRGRLCREALDPRARNGDPVCPDSCPLLGGRIATDGAAMFEVDYRRQDGSRVPAEVSYAVIRSERGQILGAIIGARDITARREAEDLQSTFLSVISHELQTPITIIQGYAEFLADPEVNLAEGDLRQKLRIIGEESQRLRKMVENLLTASRVQAGSIELRPEPLDLGWLVDRVAQRLQMAHRDRRLAIDLPADLPPVMADAERIEQVLLNLIENAFKYSPPEGRVTIGGRSTGTEVVLTVTDQGTGIPAAERDRIFQRFQRLDSRLVRQLKGAGLGLYVCKAIVEAHGGRIWVEDASTGGAAFSFSLPRERVAALPVRFRP